MVVLAGDTLDFWSSRSAFVHMLRYRDGRNHKPLVIDENHIEFPELFNDLITLDTFQKSGGVFVYDKSTGEPSINPKKGYTLDDIYVYLDYLGVDEPHAFLMELASKQINRPRKLVKHFNNNNNLFVVNTNNLENISNNTNTNTNNSINLGFKNNNEERAYSRITKRNLKKIKNKTRRVKNSKSK
jgi:hypothetical protein